MRSNKYETFKEVGLYANADHKNKEGFASFTGPLEEHFIQCLLTNTVSNTFYANKEDLAKEAIALHKQMLDKDPEFYAKALVYARNEGFMKLQPVLGLVNLSTKDRALSNKAFKNVCLIPTDVEKLISLARSGVFRKGLGTHLKTMIKQYLRHKLNEYYAIKYKTQIKDAIRVSRPALSVFSDLQGEIVRYIMDDKSPESSINLSQIGMLETMKRTENESEIIDLINKGRLPVEAVVGALKKTTPKIWEALMKQMPYMRLLRMLATLNKNKIFDNPENIKYVVGKLTDEKAVRYSKILPFRFYTAYMTATDLPRQIKEALSDALELSFINMPELKGQTMIAMDQSGSMSSNVTGGTTQCYQLVGLFAAAMLRRNPDTIKEIIGFESNAFRLNMNSRDSIMTNAAKSHAGGGTYMEAPIKFMLDNKIFVDNMIYFTDNEEWGEGLLRYLREYKQRINPKVKCFFVTLMPYNDRVTPSDEPNCYYISGWSDRVLNYIPMIAEGISSQVDEVKKVRFDADSKEVNESELED